jgi:uncharacterized protein
VAVRVSIKIKELFTWPLYWFIQPVGSYAGQMIMDVSPRQEVVLAALAADNGAFAPVQVQKLFFLLDENIADRLGGKQFGFEAYDYGPFDKNVYRELERLASMGLVQIISTGFSHGGRVYSVTPSGQQVGEQMLGRLDTKVADYIKSVSHWVRSLSFAELVGSIYKAYPRMKENSVFVE